MSEYIVSTDDLLPDGTFSCDRGEIVRCRDCWYYDPNDEPSEVYPDRYWCDKLTFYMPTDGFCSFGKRKEGGDD